MALLRRALRLGVAVETPVRRLGCRGGGVGDAGCAALVRRFLHRRRYALLQEDRVALVLYHEPDGREHLQRAGGAGPEEAVEVRVREHGLEELRPREDVADHGSDDVGAGALKFRQEGLHLL